MHENNTSLDKCVTHYFAQNKGTRCMYRSVATPHANCDVTHDASSVSPSKCPSNGGPHCESLAPGNVYKGISSRNDHCSGKERIKRVLRSAQRYNFKSWRLKAGRRLLNVDCFANKITHRVKFEPKSSSKGF